LEKYFFRGLAHIGIMTDDPKRCAKFYVDNLGFRYYHEKDLGHLQLAFVENGGLVIEFVSRGAISAAGAVDHIALEVQGIEALVNELRAKGVDFETKEISYMDVFPCGCKNIFFIGPAGERLELFDFTK